LADFTPEFSKRLEDFFAAYKKFYQDAYNKAVAAREAVIYKFENEKGSQYRLNEYKNKYYNESLADLVQNVSEKDRIVEYNGQLIQQINPIFLDPKPRGPLDYRAHFFAPQKNLLGATVSTFLFNNLVIWIMTVLLYITLYFELLRKLIGSFDRFPGKMSLNKVAAPKKK
jgi:ABC transport system ATP-binding/permease protein